MDRSPRLLRQRRQRRRLSRSNRLSRLQQDQPAREEPDAAALEPAHPGEQTRSCHDHHVRDREADC